MQRFFLVLLEYSKTGLKWPLKNRQIKVLKTDYRLMQVKSIAESLNAGQKYCRMLPLGEFCNTFDLH